MLGTIDILGSNSSGNCYVLTFDDNVKFQFDAGVKNKNSNLIKNCFVSHSHIDHNKYVKDFSNQQLIEQTHMERVTPLYESFVVPHAALNNGYVLNYDGEQIVYITDCGDWTKINKTFPNATILMIEANWDYFRIKQGIIPPSDYSEYSFGKLGHMSNLDCLNLIAKLQIPATCKILLLHRSNYHADVHNTYKMFDSLPNKCLVANAGIVFAKSWKLI